MSESFQKFKKKILIEILVKSIALSLSLGLLSISLPLLYIKIKGLEFKTLYLILIGLGVSIVAFLIIYFISKPTNKKVAKRLDKELALNQKVQTMIEYEKEDNLIVNLQRESTLKILSNTPLKNLTMKFSAFIIVLLAISMSLSITAFAVPNAKDITSDPGIVDPDYNLDNWTVRAIKDLIDNVKASSIDETLKEKYVAELNDLITQLELVDKESEMINLVNSIIESNKLELDKVNTNNEVYLVLKESGTDHVTQLAVQFNLLNTENIYTSIEGFAGLINGSKDAIIELEPEFRTLLKTSNLDKNDPLYLELVSLADALYNCKDDSDLFTSVRNVLTEALEKIKPIVEQQAENKEITEYVENGLKTIFGLHTNNDNSNEDQLGNNSNNSSDDDDDDDEPKEDLDGGLGTGEVLFGSDEEFFDKELGKVSYGDVITEYYGDIIGLFNDGVISEEYREYFNKYFEILFGTIEDEE